MEEVLESPSLKNPFEKIVKKDKGFAWVNLDVSGNVLEQKGIYTFKTDLKILSGKPESRVIGKALSTKDKPIKAKPIFNKRTSEHLIKLAELISRGKEVFENEEKFKRWLNTPIGAFQGKKPIEYIDTITGIEMILDELGRIEHGIFY